MATKPTSKRKKARTNKHPKTPPLTRDQARKNEAAGKTHPLKGNGFWRLRTKHGRDKLFKDPTVLWDACLEYVEAVEKNPLYEAKPFQYEGRIVMGEVPKMRAMTIGGLVLFLGIDRKTWADYRKQEDFSPICEAVEEMIKEQKFTGAAAGFLNAQIIARDLGLKDQISAEHTGRDGGPIEHVRRTIVRAGNPNR